MRSVTSVISVSVKSYFFFQAEDGIRDTSVTGVQTCALPIYPASIYGDQLALAERVAVQAVQALGLRNGIAFPQLIAEPDGGVAVVEVAARIRSEERRVGKECGCGWPSAD